MSKLQWSVIDFPDHFDFGKSGATIGEWRGSEALCFQGVHCFPILLREPLAMGSFLIRAEVACTPDSFVGFVFGAADPENFELIYVSADIKWDLPNLQYDPFMNGSSTWQIYHGAPYQAFVPVPPDEWVRFSLKVQPSGVSAYFGEDPEPKFVITRLPHETASGGKIGVWGSSAGYLRNLAVEKIEPAPPAETASDRKWLEEETYVTEWLVSEPYKLDHQSVPADSWHKVYVEENGTLNLNRLYPSAKGSAVQTKISFYVPEKLETRLNFGFSDRLRLWVNDEEVYQGEWYWHSPGEATDGRIRSTYASIPVRWGAGLNTIRAEVASEEVLFGWGLAVQTGLSNMAPITG